MSVTLQVKKLSINIADYQELLITFADLDSGKIVFDADKFKSLWNSHLNFPVDDAYWKMDNRKFLVSQELYDRIFNDYAENLISLMAKINSHAKILKPDILAGIGGNIKNFIFYNAITDIETLSAFDVKFIGFNVLLKSMDAHIFTDGNKRLAAIASFEMVQNLAVLEITVKNQEFLANVIYYYLHTNKKFPEPVLQYEYFECIEF